MNKIFNRFRQLTSSGGYTYELFDYLEHTGHNEYIRIPFHPTEKTNLKFRYSVPTITEECEIFGCRNSNRTTSFYWYQNTTSGGSIFSRTGNAPQNFGNTILYDWYTVEGASTQWVRKRPGTTTTDQYRNWEGTAFTVLYDLFIFAINHADIPASSPINQVAGVKMAAMDILEDQIILMHLHPAKRSDGRTGYLDTLSGEFHMSVNEYDFNVGNFEDEYVFYDYLESTQNGSSGYLGLQAIDTKIPASSNVHIKVKAQLTQANRFYLFGARDSSTSNQLVCRLVSLSKPGITTFDYGTSSQDAYMVGSVDINEIYTIELFDDYNRRIERTDSSGNIISIPITGSDFTGTSNITLFGMNSNNGYDTGFRDQGRVGDTQIWVGNVKMRDYRSAVRKYDSKTGMFDSVDNILYQDRGGREFLYGNWITN